jgi:hypothetical protein
MAILADPDMTGPEAVKYIQKVHCAKAVETSSQEWFVRWFRAWYLGTPFSEMEPKGWSSGSSSTVKTTVVGSAPVSSRGEPIHVTIGKDGTTEEIYADGTIVTTFGGTADSTPKGGNATSMPNGEWCAHCGRNVFSWHNQDCPDNADVKVWAPDENKGNVAPGATANARRRAEKRQRRAEGAKRAKARRQSNYRNTPERVG